jgi:hypothetical protein
VTLRARWVTLKARWVTLRARWVTLRARWVTLRARWVSFTALRSRVLRVPVQASPHVEASYGAAVLARKGITGRWK